MRNFIIIILITICIQLNTGCRQVADNSDTQPVVAINQGYSLSKERVEKIKSSTVRITIEGKRNYGTGFFINDSGTVLTNWHVIKNAIVIDNGVGRISNIFIEDNTGVKHEMAISPDLLNDNRRLDAIAYDFCALIPKNKMTNKDFLRLGRFDDVDEGEQVYTCGYPLGIKRQFISTGIVSTKFIEEGNAIIVDGKVQKMPSKKGLLDLRFHHGSSGSAIIKVGKTISDDVVIGIASILINESKVQDSTQRYRNDIGIGACIAIDHYLGEHE